MQLLLPQEQFLSALSTISAVVFLGVFIVPKGSISIMSRKVAPGVSVSLVSELLEKNRVKNRVTGEPNRVTGEPNRVTRAPFRVTGCTFYPPQHGNLTSNPLSAKLTSRLVSYIR